MVMRELVSININDVSCKQQQQQYLFAKRRTQERASAHQSWFLTKSTYKL